MPALLAHPLAHAQAQRALDSARKLAERQNRGGEMAVHQTEALVRRQQEESDQILMQDVRMQARAEEIERVAETDRQQLGLGQSTSTGLSARAQVLMQQRLDAEALAQQEARMAELRRAEARAQARALRGGAAARGSRGTPPRGTGSTRTSRRGAR